MKIWIQSKSGNHNSAVDYPTLRTSGEALKRILDVGYYYDSDRNAVPASEIEYVRPATEEEYRNE